MFFDEAAASGLVAQPCIAGVSAGKRKIGLVLCVHVLSKPEWFSMSFRLRTPCPLPLPLPSMT